MSEDETFERGIFFEQLCTVGSNIIDGSSSCERAVGTGHIVVSWRGGASCRRSQMVSAAVARGRLGSEEIRVGRRRTVERITTRREEL